ncbi:hypothetical protein EVAR_38347_1 [Eumeta japonica]|uniref:Uncharacterized protein n=1 Tax=Eumeta variegata TaxID=151549 RepID=A0A4C1XZZ6_EUMVA|nr:hypothetical protein EVAR_38347_1 [Eumeta japonica]
MEWKRDRSFALSLARSAQAERDNESYFFVRAAGVHRFKRRSAAARASPLADRVVAVRHGGAAVAVSPSAAAPHHAHAPIARARRETFRPNVWRDGPPDTRNLLK